MHELMAESIAQARTEPLGAVRAVEKVPAL